MIRTTRFAPGTLLALGLLVAATPALALPRYAARYEQNCALCHVNPAGGGLRTTYATQYLAPTELVLRPYSPEALEKIDPQVSKSILIGADFRTMYHASDDHSEYPNFFNMQGDFYAQYQSDPRFMLYFDKGLSRSTEAWALGYVLPWTGYIKVGRFSPPFGWRFADHTAFVKDKLGLFPPGDSDTGIEFGISPGRLDVQAAILNGALGSVSDSDKRVSHVVNVTRQATLGDLGGVGTVGVALGAGYWHDQYPGGARSTGGPHGYLKVGRAIWLGQADWSRIESEAAAPHTEWVTTHEATYEFLRGTYLRATYDFLDPDLDRKTGSRSRLGVGFDFLPVPSVGVMAMWNVFRHDEARPDGNAPAPNLGDEYEQLEVQLHLFY